MLWLQSSDSLLRLQGLRGFSGAWTTKIGSGFWVFRGLGFFGLGFKGPMGLGLRALRKAKKAKARSLEAHRKYK